jgi:hypothetical protein
MRDAVPVARKVWVGKSEVKTDLGFVGAIMLSCSSDYTFIWRGNLI